MGAVNRANWREHCQEPELNETEIQERLLMRYNFRRMPGLFDYIQSRAKVERGQVPQFSPAAGWDKFAQWADATRRVQRAELTAWRKYKVKGEGNEQVRAD